MYNISQNKFLIINNNQIINLFINMKFNKLLFLLVLFGYSEQLFSQQSGGGYAESYLFRNIGARPTAMAGAFTAIVNDPSAVFYNPAGVGFLTDQPMLTSTVSLLGFGRTQSSIAWGQQIYEDFGVGIGINGLNSGTFQARDIKGRPLGEVSDIQYAIYGAASYRIDFMSMGATLKYFTNSLNGTPTFSNGFALDVGTKLDIMGLFSVGIAVQNISGMVFWNNLSKDREDVPYQVRAGVAMEFGLNEIAYETRSTVTGEIEDVSIPPTRYVLIGLDAVLTQFQRSPDFVFGVEAAAHEMIVFRGGISLYGDNLGEPQFFPMNYWGGGVSIRPEIPNLPFNLNIDYTISQDHISENRISHHISLLFAF